MPRLTFALVALLCVFATATTNADLISADSGNLAFLSSNAVSSTSDPNYTPATGFDGLTNATGDNGAVFDLTAQNPSTWTVDLIDVTEITSVNLFQRVGIAPDNGIENFQITFFSGDNLSGSTLHTESFSALLNPANTSEIFNFSSAVANPESFSLQVTSSFGADTHAEFSEFNFTGTAVPEPAAVTLLGLFSVGLGLRRRRKS